MFTINIQKRLQSSLDKEEVSNRAAISWRIPRSSTSGKRQEMAGQEVNKQSLDCLFTF